MGADVARHAAGRRSCASAVAAGSGRAVVRRLRRRVRATVAGVRADGSPPAQDSACARV